MTTRDECKINILNDILIQFFGEKFNLARIKFIGLFITALCSARTVCFERLALCFDNDSKSGSSLRRIQRFFADYKLDTDIIACLIFKLLPHDPPYRLAIDRTNWKFGCANINILVVAIVYEGVAFPIIFKLLPKFGNSSTAERIELIDKFIQLFGVSSIDCLMADREFIGANWLKYLNQKSIRYYIRIRNNFILTNKRNKRKYTVTKLFKHLKPNQSDYYQQKFLIENQECYISGSLAKNKFGKPEFLVIVSFDKPIESQANYKERWQIESAFKALKSSGFNLEDTHLTDLKRIEKLLSLVIIAFVWAYKTGIYLNSIIPIKIKKHKRKAKSLFKYGLDHLTTLIMRNDLAKFRITCNFLSCT